MAWWSKKVTPTQKHRVTSDPWEELDAAMKGVDEATKRIFSSLDENVASVLETRTFTVSTGTLVWLVNEVRELRRDVDGMKRRVRQLERNTTS
jgi:ubiquinone biosynthesis protein UbiJ